MNSIKQLKTYSKLCTEFYDLEDHPNHAEALAFYINKALQANGLILEPMCGTGRFLIPILKLGLNIEGFDASPDMLQRLIKKYSFITKKEPPVWQEFVQDFNNNKFYKLIFIPYGSFGLLTNIEDVKKGLASFYRHLDINGKLIIDIETLVSVPKNLGVWNRGVNTRIDGSKIALNAFLSYDEKTQIFKSNSRYESIVNNKIQEIEEEVFEQYIYKFDEFDKLLLESGFTNIKKYPAYDDKKIVTKDTPTIVYECRK